MYPDPRNKNEDTIVHDYVHDTFKEMFYDSNYEIIWADTESIFSREHGSTYGRSKAKSDPTTFARLSSFVRVIITSRRNTSELKSFGGHICEGYIYLGMMDLEYDGIYRYQKSN
ncbi:hypothetical protein RclHR1_02560006 [Rhizophagus clarus]|uniref:Uncharacterized protein n=1 Tax=Rhizophagus clarus TaxID=94130 RepID=A0A2Z6RU07_9GLOM|nr:hypothetical protein RclHR1_02560006 [Rhizophagus clarus]